MDDDLVAMVEYSDSARVEWYLNEYMSQKSALEAVNEIPWVTGNTATHSALWLVRNLVLTSSHGDRPNVPDVVILITDGGTSDVGMATNEAKLLHSSGTNVIAIGVGLNVDPTELDSYKSSRSFHVVSYGMLTSITRQVVQALCI